MTNKLSILIVEDELLIAEMLSDLLLDLGHKVLGIAKNYNQAKTFLETKPDINFVFLDVNLGGAKTGIDLANYINENYKTPFIYTTAYTTGDIIDKALSTNPNAYLVKPYNAIDLYTTLKIHNSKVKTNTIVVKDGHLNIKINTAEILWISSENNYIEIHTVLKKYVLRYSLEAFLADLNDVKFMRTHRSFIVNIEMVKVVNTIFVKINDVTIPLSRKYREALLKHFESEK